MKLYENSTKILLIIIGIYVFPCFVFSQQSRKDFACGLNNISGTGCEIISKNYTQPYCVTNFSHEDYDSDDVNYAKSCIIPALTKQLPIYKTVNSDLVEKKYIIQQYCVSLLGKSDTGRFYFAKPSSHTDSRDRQQTFDSHQSLFLYALCSSFTKNGKTPFLTENALLGDAFKGDIVESLKLRQMSNGKDLCSLNNIEYGITNCDMAVYATKIYAGIMSDLFKIKYAQVLNVDNAENFEVEKEKKIIDFMSGYFHIIDDNGKGVQKGNNFKTQYPKTFSILTTDQKYYKDVLDTVKIIDNSKLSRIAQENGCPTEGNITGINFIACALHSSQGNGFSLTPSFVTLFYNEILHYRQFIAYYEKRLTEYGKKFPSEKERRIIESEILDFKHYSDVQIEASKLVQRNFEEFNMTYPLHIRLLLYIEKSEKYRNDNLSPIVTLFYSLSEKLQNVQIPSS